MRDPERIPRILRQVYLIWRAEPDLRLLQLLMHVADGALARKGGNPPSYLFRALEDDKMETALDNELTDRVSIVDRLAGLEGFEAVIRDD
jgi:hypothetical protein